MNFAELLESIPVITEHNCGEYHKMTLEDVVQMHPSLDYEDPLTYAIFLQNRPDLDEIDRDHVLKIIKRLADNRQAMFKAITKDMIDVSTALKNNS